MYDQFWFFEVWLLVFKCVKQRSDLNLYSFDDFLYAFLNICSPSNLIFRALTLPVCKRHEQRDRLLALNMDSDFQILRADFQFYPFPVFSNFVAFITRFNYKMFFEVQRAWPYNFFLEIRNLMFFSKSKSVIVWVLLYCFFTVCWLCFLGVWSPIYSSWLQIRNNYCLQYKKFF